VLRPELILYYKAQETRPRDEADFDALLPLLAGSQAGWLQEALRQTRAGHHWLSRLAGAPAR
jgi:hypothetical protein